MNTTTTRFLIAVKENKVVGKIKLCTDTEYSTRTWYLGGTDEFLQKYTSIHNHEQQLEFEQWCELQHVDNETDILAYDISLPTLMTRSIQTIDTLWIKMD